MYDSLNLREKHVRRDFAQGLGAVPANQIASQLERELLEPPSLSIWV